MAQTRQSRRASDVWAAIKESVLTSACRELAGLQGASWGLDACQIVNLDDCHVTVIKALWLCHIEGVTCSPFSAIAVPVNSKIFYLIISGLAQFLILHFGAFFGLFHLLYNRSNGSE